MHFRIDARLMFYNIYAEFFICRLLAEMTDSGQTFRFRTISHIEVIIDLKTQILNFLWVIALRLVAVACSDNFGNILSIIRIVMAFHFVIQFFLVWYQI